MKPIILFRKGYDEESEFDIAFKYFDVVENRALCEDRLVSGRYSVLPFYRETEQDLKYQGCELINTHRQHTWIANFDYYWELMDYTPESWLQHEFPYSDYDGTTIVKGRTNSFKQRWRDLMFAENRKQAFEVARRLYSHHIIEEQGLIYRRFVPLKTFETNPISGLPITNEHRLFFYRNQLLAHGYYWSSLLEDTEKPTLAEEGLKFAQEVAEIASKHVNFFVLDIGEKEEGGWILIEMNDAQMSGLSDVNSEELYKNLRSAITER